MNKTQITWLFVIVALLIVAVMVWYFTRTPKVPDPNKTNIPVPTGSPTPKWIPESFPLNIGMFGAKIKALQKVLGITEDGKFGPQTNAAIISAGYTVPLSEPNYNLIINPSIGKIAYAGKDGIVVYNSNSSIYKTAKKGDWLGTVIANPPGTSIYEYTLVGDYRVGITGVDLR